MADQERAELWEEIDAATELVLAQYSEIACKVPHEDAAVLAGMACLVAELRLIRWELDGINHQGGRG